MAKTALAGRTFLLAVLLAMAATPASAQLLSGLLSGGGGASDDGSGPGIGNIHSPIGGIVDGIVDPVLGGGIEPAASDPVDDLGAASITHDAAIAAVRENRAMPLERLLPLVQRIVPGQVIDVRLLEIRATLYYEVKVLAQSGVLYLAYFDALTGAFVQR